MRFIIDENTASACTYNLSTVNIGLFISIFHVSSHMLHIRIWIRNDVRRSSIRVTICAGDNHTQKCVYAEIGHVQCTRGEFGIVLCRWHVSAYRCMRSEFVYAIFSCLNSSQYHSFSGRQWFSYGLRARWKTESRWHCVLWTHLRCKWYAGRIHFRCISL